MEQKEMKALIIQESKKEIESAVLEIKASSKNPLFGKYLKPIGDFIKGFSRKLFVMAEIQNEEIEDLKNRLMYLENQAG